MRQTAALALDVASKAPVSRLGGALAIALLVAIYAGVLAWLPRGVFWHPDEGAKYFIMHTIGAGDAQAHALPYRGVRLDPEYRFYPRVPYSVQNLYPDRGPDGRIVMQMPPWFPWLTQAPYSVFGVNGVYVIPLLSGLLTAVAAGWLTHRLAPTLAPAAILIVGLATPVCFYSFCFWEHTLATLLALLAIALLIRPHPGWKATLSVALLACATLLFRLEMLAFVLALPIAWVVAAARAPGDVRRQDATSTDRAPRRRLLRAGALMVAVAALCALPLMLPRLPSRHYDRIASLPRAFAETISKLAFLPDSVVSIWINFGRGEAPALPLALAWLGLLGVLLCFVAAFVRAVRIEAALIISGLTLLLVASLRLLLWPLPYRALHGVFPIAPALAVFPYALVDAWRRRSRSLLIAALLTAVYLPTATLAVFAFYVTSSGSYLPALEWGPRFFLPLYPLMTVLTLAMVSQYWQSARPSWLKRTVVSLLALGVFIGLQFEGRGLLMLAQTQRRLALWEQALPAAEPVVTDIWWIPAALAPYFVDHEVFHAPNDQRLRQWIALVRKQGVTSFAFVGFHRPTPDGAQPIDVVTVGGLQITRFRVGE